MANPADMPDDGSSEYATHLTTSALPTLNALPHLGRGGQTPTLWDGRIAFLPTVNVLPKCGIQPAPPVNQV